MAEERNYEELLTGGVPHNTDAEQSVLGGILLDSEQIPTVMELLKPESFYLEAHRGLYSTILGMFTSGIAVDFVTVCDKAVTAGVFRTVEEAKAYLAQLIELTPTTANLGHYCRIVREKYYLRTLRQVAAQILADVDGGEADANTLLDAAEQRIYDIRKGRDVGGLVRIDSVILDVYDRLAKLSGEEREEYIGLPTGYPALDRMVRLHNGNLILIAARPAVGKTSFAMNIAEHVATRCKKTVAVFSLEMAREELVSRMLSSASGLDSRKLREGIFNDEEWTRLAEGAERIATAPIYLDTANLTVAGMKANLLRMKNLGLVIIDYLQLMSSGNSRLEGNRVQEISTITRNLKIMAKELDVPVILLSQLNRSPEQRKEGHRPQVADLRDSGSIEQDADAVLLLYRDAVYNEEASPNEAECIVGKNRHGATGTVPLYWDGAHTRFLPVEERYG